MQMATYLDKFSTDWKFFAPVGAEPFPHKEIQIVVDGLTVF